MKVRHKRNECAEMAAVSHVSVDSVRVAAESIGIGVLPDDAARELAEHTTHRLRLLVQDAAKFHAHSKRKRLHLSDIDNAIKLRNMEPIYGLSSSEHVPFRFASGGGRELGFHDDRELLDLADVVNWPVPRAPLDTAVKVHWLCIDGVQPTVPENPAPKSSDQQKQEATNPAAKISRQPLISAANKSGSSSSNSANQRPRTIETVSVKQLAQHELSVELQLFYKEITEACVGSDEARRTEALQSLSSDPGLHQMLPRLCNFIFEGVKVNVVQYNLALLIYLMRMVKALLDNQTLFLEKYLHELIPSVTSCIVSRQLCARPDVDNHWALRDFAARLIALISKQFSTSTNSIQTRVSRLFIGCLENQRAPLAAHYGAIVGLIELGGEVIKACVLPQLATIGRRIDQLCTGGALTAPNSGTPSSPVVSVTTPVDRKACEHFKELFKRKLCSVLCTLRSPPDSLDQYRADYGTTLGYVLYTAVLKERQQQQQQQQQQQSVAKPVSIVGGAGVGGGGVGGGGNGGGNVAAVTPRPMGGSQRAVIVTGMTSGLKQQQQHQQQQQQQQTGLTTTPTPIPTTPLAPKVMLVTPNTPSNTTATATTTSSSSQGPSAPS